MRVVACARRTERLDELRDQLLQQGHLQDASHMLGVRCDVQIEEDIQRVFVRLKV
jgi:NAD(P)-dependent dehydrogenase (short-subunit alcohol dehydrogenase family)